MIRNLDATQSPYRHPGALHQIIVRSIERRKIFYDNTDRDNFLARLGSVLTETSTPCGAWALIPNHLHLLLKTGFTPIATVTRRRLTGYAVTVRLSDIWKLNQKRYWPLANIHQMSRPAVCYAIGHRANSA
jgi:REP element-mobilizing transposase RayT